MATIAERVRDLADDLDWPKADAFRAIAKEIEDLAEEMRNCYEPAPSLWADLLSSRKEEA